jgi:hypothetical protein
MTTTNPSGILDVIIHEPENFRGLSGVSISFEMGIWRVQQFSKYLFRFLPEFALSYSERKKIDDQTSVELLRCAAELVYTSKKFEKRGEFGELILHALIRDLFQSNPAISKIYYKDSHNSTVKGFDAVHIVVNKDSFELWLGEAKFYEDINDAIRAIIEELKTHSECDYLRREFALITNKIDISWEHAEKLKLLLNPDISLDKIFERVCIPVLLTYESETVKNYCTLKDEYETLLKSEILKHYHKFLDSDLPNTLKIHLILLPLKDKNELIQNLHGRLEAWQKI